MCTTRRKSPRTIPGDPFSFVETDGGCKTRVLLFVCAQVLGVASAGGARVHWLCDDRLCGVYGRGRVLHPEPILRVPARHM